MTHKLISSMEYGLAELSSEIDELANSNEEKDAKISSLENTIDDLRNEIVELNNDLRKAHRSLDEY